MTSNKINITHTSLLKEISELVEQARKRVAVTANHETTMLYWNIGKRINDEILNNQRAEYGKQITAILSQQLKNQFGAKGFEIRSLQRMMQFAEKFPNIQIASTLSTQLSWSHFVELLPLQDELQRDFYSTMAVCERWGVRTLRAKIDGMLFERTAISEKPDETIKMELSNLRNNDIITPDLVFRSPYFLDFTGLKGMYSEKTLEDSLLVSLQEFIMELGAGFSFIERQKRMIIDGEDFYLDLLFYHRKLHRLIAVELKLGRFKAAYKGQMELYLRWLEKNEVERGEESPLGLILCTEGGDEQIELLQLDKAGIKVAKYLTELPDKHLLEQQLKQSLSLAKERFANTTSSEEE